MASHLCSCPSSPYRDSGPRFNPFSSWRDPRVITLLSSFTPISPSLRFRISQISRVSVREPVSPQSLNGTDLPEPHHPGDKSTFSSKSYIWVNPNSHRASLLFQKSYGSRYRFLVRIAESLNSCNPNELEISNVLVNLGEKILERDAVTILNNMSNPETAPFVLKYFRTKLKPMGDVILYNVTLKVLRKSRDFSGAEKLFNEMLENGVKPDIITFSTVIHCAILSNFPTKAVELYERMPEFGCEPDDLTYSAMIDAYGRTGNADKALSLYDRAKAAKWKIEPPSFLTLIKIHSMAGNFDGCLNVYEEMKALGVMPNLAIYNSFLDATGRAKRPRIAKDVYKEIINNGYTPSLGTYAALLRAYGRARYAEDAIEVYKEMKDKGMELNVTLYNTLLATCADVGCTDNAVEIYEDMKCSETCKPDSWTYSSMMTIYSCSGKISEAEGLLNEMVEAGFEPNIFVMTSLIHCYGKANRIDDVVRAFGRLSELGITADDWFCGCLLSVIAQTPKEEHGKLIDCIEKADPKLGHITKLLVEEHNDVVDFRKEVSELIDSVGANAKKIYCNCLLDLCVNLNMLQRACELLDLALARKIYKNIQHKSPYEWLLHVKGLSVGAALTAFHVWMNDLCRVLESGEVLPPQLGINTGHGKHKYSDKGLASVFESHLMELNAPFHEVPERVGWFLTTDVAAKAWLESRKIPQVVIA